jgi:hypothetical protein
VEVLILALFIAVAFIGVMLHIGRMVFGAPNAEARPPRLPASVVGALSLSLLPVIALGVYMPPLVHRLLVLAAASISH